MQCTIGGTSYRLFALEGDGSWVARAFRTDTGERFGVDVSGPTEDVAVERLQAWLEWHHAHVAALSALQEAERAYHRAVTAGAFDQADAAAGARRAALDALAAAREALDRVRGRQPGRSIE